MSKDNASAPAVPAHYLGSLITGAELCKQLKITPKYLRWLRRRHGLPALKVGGELRFYPPAVNAWLEQRTATPRGRQS